MSGIMRLGTVDSTNGYALANFADLSDKALLVADAQAAGRGRRGRKWISPPGANIYATFVLRKPSLRAPCYSWVGCLAALETLRKTAPEQAFWIKWPNDILAGREIRESRKISGILCENRIGGGSGDSEGIAIGVGININMDSRALSEISVPATSLSELTGREWPLDDIIRKLHDELVRFCSTPEETLFRRWESENRLKGLDITVLSEGRPAFSGILESFGPDAEILVRGESSVMKFHSGDASLADTRAAGTR